jgi:hypothetical protein
MLQIALFEFNKYALCIMTYLIDFKIGFLVIQIYFETHKHSVRSPFLISKSSELCNAPRLCGLVVTVPGYRSAYPGFDSLRYQIF